MVLRFSCPAFFDLNKPLVISVYLLGQLWLFLKGSVERERRRKWAQRQGGGGMHSQHLAPCFFILSSTFASRGDSSFWLSMKFPSFVYRVPVCPPEQSLPSSQRKYLLRVFFQRSIFHLTAPISSEEVNLMTLICKSSSFFFFSFFCLAHLTCLVIF